MSRSKKNIWVALLLCVALIMQTGTGLIPVFATQNEEMGTETEDSQNEENMTNEPEASEEHEQQQGPSGAFSPVTPYAIIDGQELEDISQILQALIDNGTLPPGSSTSILDYFTLTFYEAGTEPPVQTTTPSLGDTFNMDFFFTLPQELLNVLEGGEYYDFHLPPELIVNQPQEIPLIDPDNGLTYGTITVDTSGNVRIQFNDNITSIIEVDNAGGTIYGSLDKGDMTEPGDNEIKIPGEENVPGVPIEVKPNVDSSISKDGSFDRVINPNLISWTVEANKDLNSLTDAVITDTLPPGVNLPATNIAVYTFDVDFDGNPIPGSETQIFPPAYTITSDGTDGTLRIEFPTLDTPVRVQFDTEIDRTGIDSNGQTLNFQNNVNLSSNEVSDLNASASLTATYKARLEKNAIGYNPSNQSVTWEILYNFDEATLNGWELTDRLQEQGMDIDYGSFIVREVTINPDGSYTYGNALTPGLDYNVLGNPDGSFTVESTNPLNTALSIQYTSFIDGILDQNSVYNNVVNDGDGHEGNGSSNVNQQNVIKRVIGYDVSKNTVTWQLEINLLHEEMHNWVLTDSFPDAVLLPDTLSVLNRETGQMLVGNNFPNNSGDYMLQNGIPAAGFTLSLLNNYNPTTNSFLITYTTEFDGINVPDLITNTAHVDWIDNNNDSHSSEDLASLRPSKTQQDNGKKGGSYDATTKVITWDLAVNYVHTGLQNAYINDPIVAPQHFVPGSVRIYHYTENAAGDIQVGAELTPEEYATFTVEEPNMSNGHVLHIDIPDGDQDALYYFTFQTSLDGEDIESNTYPNDALFHNDLTEDHNLHADVSVANGGRYVGKQGFQNPDESVSWSITVNPSQSQISDVVIKDVPDDNQLIDIDSVVIHQTNVAANGNITIDNIAPPLQLGTDYTIDYYQNVDGLFEMDITFIGAYAQIDRPYIVTYDVTVITNQTPGTTITLNNDVSINYNTTEENTQGGGTNVEVDVGGGTGWIVGTVGSIAFRKVDAVSGTVLPGVSFELYYTSGATPRLIGTQVLTNANGTIAFSNLPRGNYELREISTIDGYSLLTPNPYTFNLNGNNTGTTLDIPNQPSSVTITKRDSVDNRLIPGTQFELYQETTPGSFTPIGTYTTGNDGTLSVFALGEGNYYFQETVASPGYKPDTTTQYAFSITRDGAGQMVTSAIINTIGGTVLNEPTLVRFYKYEQTGTVGLQGAEFLLEKFNTTLGFWEQYNTGSPIVSDATGMVEIRRLPPGQYRVMEITAPVYYAKDTILKFFTIDDSNIATDIIGDDFIDYPEQFVLTKLDANTGDTLAGAIFHLWWDNPVTGAYERVPDRIGEIFYTDRNGILNIGNVRVGVQYYLIEVVAPPGYSLDPTPIPFTPVSDILGQEIIYDTFENTPSVVTLTKRNDADETLSGAVFALERYDDNDDLWVRMDTLSTDENGLITVYALAIGQYRFIELVAPSGYQSNPEPITFEIEADTDGALIPVDLERINYLNSVILLKEDESENRLPGAIFTLEKQNDNGTWGRLFEDRELTTERDGTLLLDGLLMGNYRFTEVKAPDGYILNDQPLEFEINGTETSPITIGPFVNVLLGTPPGGGGETSSRAFGTGDFLPIGIGIVLLFAAVTGGYLYKKKKMN